MLICSYNLSNSSSCKLVINFTNRLFDLVPVSEKLHNTNFKVQGCGNLEPWTRNLEPETWNLEHFTNRMDVVEPVACFAWGNRIGNPCPNPQIRIPKSEFRNPNSEIPIRFTLNDNPLSELADGYGNVIYNAKLSIADAANRSPETRNDMVTVYPNPA